MIDITWTQQPASEADVAAALAAIDRDSGVWLGCDVDVPGLYRREAHAALDALITFTLDGNLLRLVAHDPLGHALAERLLADLNTAGATAPKLDVERRADRIDVRFADAALAASTPHPSITVLRRFLAMFRGAPPAFGLYGALAFDYYRLAEPQPLPDDARRRLALILPRRVLVSGDQGNSMISFAFSGVAGRAPSTPGVVPAARLERCDDDHPPGGHAQAVAKAVALMARGELYSLVLSQTFRRPVQVDAAQAFTRLRRDNPYPAMFFIHPGGGERIFGASPDVQVRADQEWVETAPVCGTYRRGQDAMDDYWQARAFMNSTVDEASLAVCADSDRNDKARVCEPGSVELVSRRRVHFFSTIIHGIDHTRGRRRADVDGFDIVLAHATPATVTGTPKPIARAAIAAIEPAWRGWYAGAAVRIGADGTCLALTMLRFARLVDGCAEVRAGGSLLVDSDPVREEEETRLKAETTFRVLAGASPRAPVPLAPWRSQPMPSVELIDGGDAWAPLLAEMLVQAGCDLRSGGALLILGDGPYEAWLAREIVLDRPTLAINHAGLALLARDGARIATLDQPRFARTVTCTAVAGGPLAPMERFDLGLYSVQRIVCAGLPAGWQPCAVGEDATLVAAIHPARRAGVLLARPDSVLSQRRSAGLEIVARLVRWLATPHDPTVTLQ